MPRKSHLYKPGASIIRKSTNVYRSREERTFMRLLNNILENMMEREQLQIVDKALLISLQIVDRFVRCTLVADADQWTPSEEMDAEIWGSKKRLGRKEASVRAESAYLRWCQSANVQPSAEVNRETIYHAMKRRASEKRQATQLAKASDEEGDINPEDFFADWVATGYRLIVEANNGKPIGPLQVLGSPSPKKMTGDPSWQYPANIKARLRTEWRTYARRHKKQFTQDVTTDTLLREKLPEVMQSVLGKAADKLREDTEFYCVGLDNHRQYFDLIDPLLSTLYKDYDNISEARKQLYKAAFYHWQWQIKRALWGFKSKSELFISIYGPTRGGKDEFIKALLGRHLSPWRYNWPSLTAITKVEQNGTFASDYLVGYVREMAVEPSLNQFAALKGILTDESVDQRVYYSQDSRSLHRRMSCISASNVPLRDISPDYTGMARFVEVVVDADRPYREANRAITEGMRDHFKDALSLKLFRLVDENDEETIFDQYSELSELLAIHQEEIRPASPLEKVLVSLQCHPAPVKLPDGAKVNAECLTDLSGNLLRDYKSTSVGELLKAWAIKFKDKNPLVTKEPPNYSVMLGQLQSMGFEIHNQGGMDYCVFGKFEAFSNRQNTLDSNEEHGILENRLVSLEAAMAERHEADANPTHLDSQTDFDW